MLIRECLRTSDRGRRHGSRGALHARPRTAPSGRSGGAAPKSCRTWRRRRKILPVSFDARVVLTIEVDASAAAVAAADFITDQLCPSFTGALLESLATADRRYIVHGN